MIKIFLCAGLLLVCALAVAATQDHAQIMDAVDGLVRQQTAALPGKVTYKIEDIDRRIALPECARLEAFLPAGVQGIGKTSVGVRCAENKISGNKGWSILVPVQIRISLKLLVSARQLPPGHTLQQQDLVSQEIETTRVAGYADPGQVIGKVLRYGIAAGQILREDMLRQPYVVTQGQTVQLAAQGGGFSVRSAGVALHNAGEGQAVQIRFASGRVSSGIARPDGVVEITP